MSNILDTLVLDGARLESLHRDAPSVHSPTPTGSRESIPLLKGICLFCGAMLLFALAGGVGAVKHWVPVIELQLGSVAIGILVSALVIRLSGRSTSLSAPGSRLLLTARALFLFSACLIGMAFFQRPDTANGMSWVSWQLQGAFVFWFLALLPLAVIVMVRLVWHRPLPGRVWLAVLLLLAIEMVFLRTSTNMVPNGFLHLLSLVFVFPKPWVLLIALASYLVVSRVSAQRAGTATLLFWDGATVLFCLIAFFALRTTPNLVFEPLPLATQGILGALAWILVLRALALTPVSALAPYITLKTAALTIVATLVAHQISLGVEFIKSPIVVLTSSGVISLAALWVGACMTLVLLMLFWRDMAEQKRLLTGSNLAAGIHNSWSAIQPNDKPLKAVHQMITGSALIGLAAVIDAQTHYSLAIEGRVLAYAAGALILALLTRQGGRFAALVPPRPIGLFVLRIAALLIGCFALRAWLHFPQGDDIESNIYSLPVYWLLGFTPLLAGVMACLFLRERPAWAMVALVLVLAVTEAGLLHLPYWTIGFDVPNAALHIAGYVWSEGMPDIWIGLVGLALYLVATRRLAPAAGYRCLLFWDAIALLAGLVALILSGGLSVQMLFLTSGFDPGLWPIVQSIAGYGVFGALGWGLMLHALGHAEITRLAPYLWTKTVVLLVFLSFVGIGETALRQSPALEMIDSFIRIDYPAGSTDPLLAMVLPVYWVAAFFVAVLALCYWRERRPASRRSVDPADVFD